MINKILRWIVLVGVFAIPVTIPFLVSSSMFFPFITFKGFAFRILTEIVFATWFLLAMADKNYRPKASWILWAVGIFLGVLFLADLFAENPHKAFWSNYERMEGFVSLFHMALYFIVAGSTLITEKLWFNFFRINLLAGFVMSCYGFLQLAGKITINQGGVRLDGAFGNATYLAGYMLAMIFIALFLILRDRNKWWRLGYSLSIVANFVILYYTATRGALLGLIGGLFLSALIVAIFGKDNKIFRKISIAIMVLAVLVPGLFFTFRNTDFVQSRPPLARLTGINTDSADAKARFMVWDMAWQGVKERPILGWGQEGFNFVFNKYYNPLMHGREQWFDRTHNIVFDWLVAAGILGLISYLSLIVFALFYIWGIAPKFIKKKMSDSDVSFSVAEKAILTGFLASYFFQNLFVFDNVVSYIIFFSFLAYLHSTRAKKLSKVDSMETISQNDIVKFYGPITIAVLIAVLWFVNVPGILSGRYIIKALTPQGGVEKNLEYFKMALDKNSFGRQEVREQLGQAAFNIVASNSQVVSQDMKLKFVTLAIDEIKKQISEVETDARNYVFLGSLYSVIGANDESIAEFEKALKLSPAKPQLKMYLATNYITKKEYKKAFEIMKSAYDSAPGVNEVPLAYAIAAIYAGEDKIADEVMKKAFGETLPTDSRLVQAYLDTKQTSKALSLAKIIAETNPNNMQSQLNFAAVYLQVGMRREAVSVLKNIIAKDPSFKERGEYYIKEIEAGRNP